MQKWRGVPETVDKCVCYFVKSRFLNIICVVRYARVCGGATALTDLGTDRGQGE
jgi:hypothetical protein